MNSPEHELQRAVADYLRLALSGGIGWWSSIDHAGASSAAAGGIRKARGVAAGVPDILVIFRGKVLWIELKAATGRLSPAQRLTAAALMEQGCSFVVARSVQAVEVALQALGVPIRARTLANGQRQRPAAGAPA